MRCGPTMRAQEPHDKPAENRKREKKKEGASLICGTYG